MSYLSETELRETPGFMDDINVGHRIIEDIRRRFDRYGSLSIKQVALVQKIAAEMRQREERRQTAESVIEGNRVEISGIVMSVKERFTRYGPQIKMTVEDSRGFRVWGSVPSKWLGHALEGCEVTFVANVEQSPDDSFFGFFKRPRPVQIVSKVSN
jgi:hypothetical protein